MHVNFLDILYITSEKNYNGNQSCVSSGSCINNTLYFFHSLMEERHSMECTPAKSFH